MQYSCYHYYSKSNQKIIIFIRNKDILNIYIGCNIHDITPTENKNETRLFIFIYLKTMF